MNPLCIAASIAAELAYIIGTRRATRHRRNRAALVVAGFNIHPNTYLAHAAAGRHGPEAQRAAQRELDCLAWFEQQMVLPAPETTTDADGNIHELPEMGEAS